MHVSVVCCWCWRCCLLHEEASLSCCSLSSLCSSVSVERLCSAHCRKSSSLSSLCSSVSVKSLRSARCRKSSSLSVLLSQSKVSAQHIVVSHQASRLSVLPSQSKVSVQHAVVDSIVVFAYDNYNGQSFTVLYSAFFQGHNINFANIS